MEIVGFRPFKTVYKCPLHETVFVLFTQVFQKNEKLRIQKKGRALERLEHFNQKALWTMEALCVRLTSAKRESFFKI